MIWTVITINAALQRAEHHVFGTLSHDGATAYQQAQKELPNTVIVAMVKGSMVSVKFSVRLGLVER